MRIKANQLRRLCQRNQFTIMCALMCALLGSRHVHAQIETGYGFAPTPSLGSGGSHAGLNQAGQEIFDPYPQKHNPFESFAGPDAGGFVQQAQFSEMVPNATDEASLGASVLSDAPASGAGSGPMVDIPATAAPGTEGMITGPELSAAHGGAQPIGEIVSEFDPMLSDEESALLYSSSSWFRRGYWYSQQDLVMFFRGQVEETFVASDQTASLLANRPQLTMADANFTYEPGMRVTLGRFLGQDVSNRDVAIEFSFFGLLEHTGNAEFESQASRSVDTALVGSDYNILNGQFALVGLVGPIVSGFTQADRQTISYNTELNSYEFNWKLMSRPRRDRLALQPSGAWVRHAASSRIVTGLAGLRGISLSERFRYRSFTDDELSGDYRLGLANDMFGVQLGGEMAEYNADWAVGGKFKAGALINFAERHDIVESFVDNLPARRNGANDEHLTALLEAGIFFARHFSPNFTGRIGYDFMYLTGIADVPNNASLDPSFSRFEITNDAYYHGLTLGIEMLW